MNDVFKIGVIVKPQGIRGDVKVQPLTDDINRFKNLKEVLIDGQKYHVSNVSIGGGMVFMELSGITDRNTAELFRGKFLCVKREDAIPLEEGRYFIADILGCKVITENKTIGEIIDITSSRTDVVTVKCENGKIMRFPFLKDLVTNVDIVNKIFEVKEKRLSEVSCYED
ncbi:MAG: 16S rRNA processing protein RimM [Clostridia bacterium]|nr:16S rRNA processing protein RimM [Clostridia bacterium]